MSIYQRIKSLREQRGMSQQELAEKVGYKTASAVNKIELGLRDINQTKIVRFADALGTTPSYLMGWTEEKNTPQREERTPEGERHQKYEEIFDLFEGISESRAEFALKGMLYFMNIPDEKLPEAVRYLQFLSENAES